MQYMLESTLMMKLERGSRTRLKRILDTKVKSFNFSQKKWGTRLFPAGSVLVFPPSTPSTPPPRYIYVLISGNL